VFDWVIESLKRQRDAKPTPRSNKFFLPLFADSSQIAQLSPVEKKVWERLAERPLELEALYRSAREQAQAAAVMVRKGMVIYSGFTPSDAAHVLDFSNHWSTEAAHLAAVVTEIEHMGCVRGGEATVYHHPFPYHDSSSLGLFACAAIQGFEFEGAFSQTLPHFLFNR
jgi:hypothetical protein